MRIYFTGAQSTGKTTLARVIAKTYSLTLISEVVRSIKARWEDSLDSIRVDLEASTRFQQEIMDSQLARETSMVSFVSDRCLDFVAYSAFHTTIAADQFHSERFKLYLNSLRHTDSIVFFVRPHQELLTPDNDRPTLDLRWDEVCRIDGAILMLLELSRVPYIPISCLPMKDRVNLCKSYIDIKK